MRFAFAGIDRCHGVFEAFVQAGWQPVKLFTVPVANAVDNHAAVTALAEEQQAPVQLTRLGQDDLACLRSEACAALIVGCYPWRIPDWQGYLDYGVNFHSSPLPEARGPYPTPRAILEGRTSWAVTCHRLAPEMDRGEILAMENFALGPDECHERLDLKAQMAAKRLAGRVARFFPQLWAAAKPQGEGSDWPKHRLTERIIDFKQPVETILRHVRAYGATESLALVNGTWLVVRRAVGWPEPPLQPPGMVAHVYNRTIVIAAADGYIGLVEADLAPAEIVAKLVAEQAL